nr:hypothetical protein [Tanacetum cinerariifolium]
MPYLSNFQELNGGYVAFGGNPKGGKISGKGKIKTGKLDFEDVYFVKELKFNLFSVSQMCDKKNKVLFTDSECLVLSPDFNLPDENQVLLRVPRENNTYNINLKDIVPSGDLTCLFGKATIDESNLWYRRLGLHMDLFGPTFIKSLNKKCYFLVITDDYSRFTWVFFLATKDETSPILKTFITGLENQLSLKVKVIRSDNGTEFKNSDINQFCELKGIKREFSVPRTPQQNGIAERKNRTLIEAARTMLADSLLPIPFWAEAVNTACYVQNRVLVTKPQKKIPYELLHGRTPRHATFDGKACDTEKPESAVNLSSSSSTLFGEQDVMTKKKDKGKSPVDYFTGNRDFNAVFDDFSENSSNDVSSASPIVPTAGLNYSNSTNSISAAGLIVPVAGHNYSNSTNPISAADPLNSNSSPTHGQSSLRDTYLPPDMVEKEDIVYSDHENVDAEADFNNLETSITRAIGTEWVYRNKKDERGIVVRNKARLVAQGHTQEEGIDYEEVFTPVVRIEAIRLFLAYASFMGFMVYQMDVKSEFLYRTIEEEVYVCQPPGFEDPDHPDKVYKVVKALYGLHQAPRAWYETLDHHLLKNGFHRGQIDQTLFIKKQKGDNCLCRFMWMISYLVKQKEDGIFINQDKYVAKILKKFGLPEGKSASTPIDTEKPLLKDLDGKDVDAHTYRSMIGSLMYLTSSRPDIMFA